jgi:hypothetical protein
MHPAFALVSLGHSQAPYKGLWRLVENHPGTVEVIHSTDHPEHPIGLPALAITRHRISQAGASRPCTKPACTSGFA